MTDQNQYILQYLSSITQHQREWFEYRWVRTYSLISGINVKDKTRGYTPAEVTEAFNRLLKNKHIVDVIYEYLSQ